jgi:drug/metabolite transporter (DMT)-like permease
MDGGTAYPYSHSGNVMKTHPRAGSSAALGALFAVGAAIVFSTAGVIVRRIDLPVWDVSFARSILLIAAISPLLLLQHRRVLDDMRRAGRWILVSGFVLAGSAVAFIVALRLAPVANVLIVCGATPFATALLARLFLHEPVSRHTLVAMTAALFGLALSVASSLQAGAALGMAVAGIVTLCMSANYVIVRHRRDVGMEPALAVTGEGVRPDRVAVRPPRECRPGAPAVAACARPGSTGDRAASLRLSPEAHSGRPRRPAWAA